MIILASESPRRKRLLEQINLKFNVQGSAADESYDDNATPSEIVQLLADRKASIVAKTRSDSLIIGADTIVVYQGSILEKPLGPDHAKAMLRSLSGNTHEVYTGVALIKTGRSGNISRRCTFFERTLVTFGALTEYEIDCYVNSGSPMDKAGAYGIQDDWGALFVERIDGDYYNVVGFPLYRFNQTLKEFAPEYAPGV